MSPEIPTEKDMQSLIDQVRETLNKGWIVTFLTEYYPDEYTGFSSPVYVKLRNFLNGNSYRSGIYQPYKFYFSLKEFYNKQNN